MEKHTFSRWTIQPRSAEHCLRLARTAAAVAVGCALLGGVAESAQPAAKAEPAIVAKCKADLAKRFKPGAKQVETVKLEAVTWPDASLGMPEPGKMYAQVLTPGYRITLEAQHGNYLYTASAKSFRYGGPVDSWFCSVLYLKNVPNEANLNGDLYQCSLMGTNTALILSGVTDFYPQSNGVVLATRRTSRSGEDLVYVRAGEPKSAKKLYSAFAVGEAATNGKGDRWAAISRPSLGLEYVLTIGQVNGDTKPQRLPLPEGVGHARVGWVENTVVIMAQEADKHTCYSISPDDATPKWEEVPWHVFPGLTDFMLSRSESLDISQDEGSPKPSVKVERVWFTGSRRPVATIDNLTMKGADLLDYGFAVIWGEKGSQQAAYGVDVNTGEVMTSFQGSCRAIKAFRYKVTGKPPIKVK